MRQCRSRSSILAICELCSCADTDLYSLCKSRQIVLVVLAVGEAYVVDLRKEHRGRVELVDEGEEDEDGYRQR